MTPDTPDTTSDIIIPPEVQAIFDKADAEGEYAAKVLGDGVQLTSIDGKTVYETVRWPQAGAWARNAMRVIARSAPDTLMETGGVL